MIRCVVVAAVLAALLAGCATTPAASNQAAEPASAVVPGSDRDAHGCIPSAGYQWCAATGKCERSWELAREQGFEASAEGFAQYCRNTGR